MIVFTFIYVDKSIWCECAINRRLFFRLFFDKYSACGCGAASFRRRYEGMNKKKAKAAKPPTKLMWLDLALATLLFNFPHFIRALSLTCLVVWTIAHGDVYGANEENVLEWVKTEENTDKCDIHLSCSCSCSIQANGANTEYPYHRWHWTNGF